MRFSMNGFRRQLSGDCERLRDLVQDIVTDDQLDKEDLVEVVNNIITHSNVVNCIYSNDDPDFTDISHLEVEHVNIDREVSDD